jgi:subtilisin family serine protease
MLNTAKERLDIPVKNKGIYDYMYLAGRGVQVYVFDSGIRTTHKLFGGRARNFGGLADTDISPYINETMMDENGHGTQ